VGTWPRRKYDKLSNQSDNGCTTRPDRSDDRAACDLAVRIITAPANFVAATEVFAELQLKCLWTCNWSSSRVAISRNRSFFSCNWSVCRGATEVLVDLQLVLLDLQLVRLANTECFCLTLYYPFSCNWCTLWVANTECFRLILYYPFSCNWCTLWVTNTECFRLILYYPFRCKRTVVRVAIDVYFELQILSFQEFAT
jgi:hypothetical protein